MELHRVLHRHQQTQTSTASTIGPVARGGLDGAAGPWPCPAGPACCAGGARLRASEAGQGEGVLEDRRDLVEAAESPTVIVMAAQRPGERTHLSGSTTLTTWQRLTPSATARMAPSG
ncbi:hypothetical protein TSOC_005349 [Tetrabaena socialis]|uniref:Uncharacterized protein n=1 Tax=Tetrabaena socialis TaxID=47790 RepID=A0A2J8A6G9_9CHLO|nr:hypothetical protein TSOC_005349 [Tetrabaena socialis]|eukprot:PNH08119.1 hypothetical protein TSOC_005349 [Tetrabaena socialis]